MHCIKLLKIIEANWLEVSLEVHFYKQDRMHCFKTIETHWVWDLPESTVISTDNSGCTVCKLWDTLVWGVPEMNCHFHNIGFTVSQPYQKYWNLLAWGSWKYCHSHTDNIGCTVSKLLEPISFEVFQKVLLFPQRTCVLCSSARHLTLVTILDPDV